MLAFEEQVFDSAVALSLVLTGNFQSSGSNDSTPRAIARPADPDRAGVSGDFGACEPDVASGLGHYCVKKNAVWARLAWHTA